MKFDLRFQLDVPPLSNTNENTNRMQNDRKIEKSHFLMMYSSGKTFPVHFYTTKNHLFYGKMIFPPKYWNIEWNDATYMLSTVFPYERFYISTYVHAEIESLLCSVNVRKHAYCFIISVSKINQKFRTCFHGAKKFWINLSRFCPGP